MKTVEIIASYIGEWPGHTKRIVMDPDTGIFYGFLDGEEHKPKQLYLGSFQTADDAGVSVDYRQYKTELLDRATKTSFLKKRR